jgi:N-acetylglutamate synthase-like GNAT family acetyltransferase
VSPQADTIHEPRAMTYSMQFVSIARKMYESFENLFTKGTQNRIMLCSEVDASILRVACRCIDISSFVSKHAHSKWSVPVMLNCKKLKENVLNEYEALVHKWKGEMILERKQRNVISAMTYLFPRITLTQKIGYQAAISEARKLMEHIKKYVKLPSDTKQQVREEYCLIIAEQTGRLTATLTGLVDETSAPIIQKYLSQAITSSKPTTVVRLANREQRSDILNQLQASRKFTSSVMMQLSNMHIYVIYHELEDDTHDITCYHGFVFVDLAVHMSASVDPTIQRIAKIAYIEIKPAHRNAGLAKRLLQWIKLTARENGYQYLYSSTLSPNETFWTKCGFRLQKTIGPKFDSIAICSVNPMSVDNLIN